MCVDTLHKGDDDDDDDDNPLTTFSFGIIYWTDTDIKQIQRKTDKLLTNATVHHTKAATERLILSRTYSNLLNKQETVLKEYFIEKNTSLLQGLFRK